MLYDDSILDEFLLTLHSELKPIFDKHGAPPIRLPTRSNISKIRKGYAAANTRLNTSILARNTLGINNREDASNRYWDETDHTIPVQDGTTIPVRIYRPKSVPQSGVPVIVLLHGGGWVMGDVTTEALLARLFTTKLGVLVVNVGFRNYPDVPFGVSTTDCYDAVKWTSANAKAYGGNCELGFILAGVSGGGTYASICAHLARDENLTPGVTGQWLSCPVMPALIQTADDKEPRHLFDIKTENRSWHQNRDAPLMNFEMEQAITNFADYDRSSVLFTPFLFDDHKNLGQMGVYVQVTGLDPWRDSGRIYAGLCEKDGARTKVKVYSGLPHCWWIFFPQLKVSSRWAEDSVQGMLWLLKGKAEDGNEEKKAKL